MTLLIMVPELESAGMEIALFEYTFEKPKPVHQVIHKYVHQAMPQKIEFSHTVLIISGKNGNSSIASDPSYLQYTFARGVETLEDYQSSKVEENSLTVKAPFGTAVRRQAEDAQD